jgi:hypothetical protein
LAIYNPLVTVFDSPSRKRCKIRPRPRFGEQLTPDFFSAEQPEQMFLLLRLGASGQQGRAGPTYADWIIRSAHASGSKLIVDDQLMNWIRCKSIGLGPMRRNITRLG